MCAAELNNFEERTETRVMVWKMPENTTLQILVKRTEEKKKCKSEPGSVFERVNSETSGLQFLAFKYFLERW